MKKLSMILTFLVIFGSSAIGHTSDECVVFEGTFEMSTRRPVAQFQYFQALDGEAILKIYDEAKDHHAKKITSATISINGKKVIRSMDFCRKKYFRFWHFRKAKFHHYSHFKQQDDVIEKTVELMKGQNSLEVMLNSMRGGKIKVVIVKPKYLASDDADCDFISDGGNENSKSSYGPCTGGSTALCDDNCPNDFNPDQADSDGDGIGDVCDDNDDGYPYLVKDTITVGKNPWAGIAVSPNGEFVYVTNYGEGTVSVIKTADSSVTNITVGKGPSGVSVSPDGAFVYVNNYSFNSVSVIDTSNHMVIGTIPVGSYPFGISMTPDGDYAYVSNYGSGTVSVIDTSSHMVIGTIPVGSRPWGVSVTPDGAYAYVSNRSSSTVSVIRTFDNTVIQSIFVGGAPSGITVTPDGAYVYVNNYSSGTVSVIRTSDNTVLDPPIPVTNGADGISVTPNGAYVYVNHHSVGTVSVIRTSDNTVIDTDPSTVEIDPILVGNQPYGGGMAVSPDGKFVYVGDYTDGTVSVIGY